MSPTADILTASAPTGGPWRRSLLRLLAATGLARRRPVVSPGRQAVPAACWSTRWARSGRPPSAFCASTGGPPCAKRIWRAAMCCSICPKVARPKGSLELVRTTDSEGRDRTRVVVTLPDLPRHYEGVLLDKLAVKVREEYGSPAPAPPTRPPPTEGRKNAGRRRRCPTPASCPGPSGAGDAAVAEQRRPAHPSSSRVAPSSTAWPGATAMRVDPAVGGRLDRHLHLHRFQDDDGLARGDGVTDRHLDLPDGAGDVSLDGRRHAPGRVGIVARRSSWRPSRCRPRRWPSVVTLAVALGPGDDPGPGRRPRRAGPHAGQPLHHADRVRGRVDVLCRCSSAS